MNAAIRPRLPFMQQQPVNTSSRKLITLIKSAYGIPLLIIAAITMASFVLLQQMMAAQQRDDTLLTLASTQKALSQRVVFLASAISDAPRKDQYALVSRSGRASPNSRQTTISCWNTPAPIRCLRRAPIRNPSKACSSESRTTSISFRPSSPQTAGASSRRLKVSLA